jgi:16S rRNA (guanine966-N2)-methyltransferase
VSVGDLAHRGVDVRGAGHRLRVIGGHLSGRRFRVPQGEVRPTSDRVREALFGRLADLDGLRVLDLYAGSGALGIEAISRGALEATFVERDLRVLRVLRGNLAALGIDSVTAVVEGDVPAAVGRLGRAGARFDLVLIDPPYGSEEPSRAFEALVDSAVLAPGAMVVLERDRRHPSPGAEGLSALDERRYGDTVVARFIAGQTE